MNSLGADYEEWRTELIGKMIAARSELKEAIDLFNGIVGDYAEDIEERLRAYNELVEEAGQIRDDAVGKVQDYIDSKPGNWAASPKYEGWIDDLNSLCLDPMFIDVPEEIYCPELGQAEQLKDEWPGKLRERTEAR